MSRWDSPYERHMTEEDYRDLRKHNPPRLPLDPKAMVIRIRGSHVFFSDGSALHTSCGVHYSPEGIGKSREEILSGKYSLRPDQE